MVSTRQLRCTVLAGDAWVPGLDLGRVTSDADRRHTFPTIHHIAFLFLTTIHSSSFIRYVATHPFIHNMPSINSPPAPVASSSNLAVRIGADVQSANPKAQPSKLHYDICPLLVEQIISHLPRGTLIPLRFSCTRLRDHIDDVLSRAVLIGPTYDGGSPINGLELPGRLPARLPLCRLSSLPQPHVLNNPNIWFACGKREQSQAAYRALARLGKAVRFIRLSADNSSCPVLVPLQRLLQPVRVLQLTGVFIVHHPDFKYAPAIPAHTVILGTMLGYQRGSRVWRSDPMIRYTPSLRKVVYNCDPFVVLDVVRAIELPSSGEMDEEPDPFSVEEIPGPPRRPRGTVDLAHPVTFVFTFHPVTNIHLHRQRAIICDALLLALRHDVRVLFVNAEILPASTFPFTTSDHRLCPRLSDLDLLPPKAERAGSALESFQAFVFATTVDIGRVAFCTMDEYRERVGACHFAEETYAGGDLAKRRECYQGLWEEARERGKDFFSDHKDLLDMDEELDADIMGPAAAATLAGTALTGTAAPALAQQAAPTMRVPPPANVPPGPPANPPGPPTVPPALGSPTSAPTNAVEGSPRASLAAELASVDLDRALAQAWVQSLTPWLDWDTAAQVQVTAESHGSGSQGSSGNQGQW